MIRIFTPVRGKRGFTLVEVIVILVILAILAAVLVPTLTGYIDKANEEKLTAYCRQATLAAQTLVSEHAAVAKSTYVSAGDPFYDRRDYDPNYNSSYGSSYYKGPVTYLPSYTEIGELAELSKGYVSYVNVDTETGKVKELTYVHSDNTSVTYIQDPSDPDTKFTLTAEQKASKVPVYIFGTPSEWSKGVQYEKGDIMTFNGLVFSCLASHKTGSRSNTRNPTVKSNKGSWELIGTTDGSIPAYNSVVRFAVGGRCIYNGNIYARTTYNLTGGQTPYSKSSSRYWVLIGPAPATESGG